MTTTTTAANDHMFYKELVSEVQSVYNVERLERPHGLRRPFRVDLTPSTLQTQAETNSHDRIIIFECMRRAFQRAGWALDIEGFHARAAPAASWLDAAPAPIDLAFALRLRPIAALA
jgi:hypothetical protein